MSDRDLRRRVRLRHPTAARLVIAVAAWILPSTAAADPATAEALFREGRRLLEEGNAEEACPKLAESQAQDPSSGTLLNLGLCHEMQHKLATAWSDYISASRLAREQGRPDRSSVAEKKAADLEPRMPRLTISVHAPVEGLQIERNDQRLGPGFFGTSVPVDAGSYTITASAPGYRPWSTTLGIAESESKTVDVPSLEPEARPLASVQGPEHATAPPAALSASPAPASAPSIAPTAPSSKGGAGPLGWIIGGAGLAALGVGTGFGLASLASYHDASNLCPSRTECSPDAMSARSSAEWKAWVSNVAVGVGVVGVGLGSWILLTGHHKDASTSVAVGGRSGGLGVDLTQRF
jgi:hypothetical protein